MGVFVIMGYTKDMIFDISYNDDTQIVRLKKERGYRKVLVSICENKFIIFTLLLTFLLVVIDLIFVVNFINILSMI